MGAALTPANPAAAAGTDALDLQTWRQQLAQSLQQSPSPRDWALGSQLLETHPASGAAQRERGVILEKAAAAAPTDRLVQTLWANASIPDPVCQPKQPCTEHWWAQARLDPANGAGWVAVIEQAWKQDDTRDAEAALEYMAGAARYNEHLGEAIAAWSDVVHRHPSPLPHFVPRYGTSTSAGVGDELDFVLDEATASAMPPVSSLFDVCRQQKHPDADPQRFVNCGKVARLLMGRSQTMVGRMFGVTLLRESHAGNPSDIPMVRTITWQYEQYIPIGAALGGGASAKWNHLYMVEHTDSEIQVIQYELRLAGIPLKPPADWKQTVNGQPIEPLDDVLDQSL